MDIHGALLYYRRSITCHTEQPAKHLPRHDLVLSHSFPRHHQRYLRRQDWPHIAHQALPQEEYERLLWLLGPMMR